MPVSRRRARATGPAPRRQHSRASAAVISAPWLVVPACRTATTPTWPPSASTTPSAESCAHTTRSRNMVMRSSSRGHPDRAVEADHLAVEHRVARRCARPAPRTRPGRRGGAGAAPARRATRCASSRQPGQHRGVEQPGRDRHHADQPCRARSRAIGRVIPTTPPLDAEYAAWPIWPVEGGDRRGVDDHAALAVDLGSVAAMRRGRQPDHVEGADQVDLDHPARTARAASGPSLPSTRPAVPMPAQLTTIRTGPRSPRPVERRADVALGGHIARRERATDGRGAFLAGRGRQIENGDLRAGRGEPFARWPARVRTRRR